MSGSWEGNINVQLRQHLILLCFGPGTLLSTVRCFSRKYTFSALGRRNEWLLVKAVSSSIPWIMPISLWNCVLKMAPICVLTQFCSISVSQFLLSFPGEGRRTADGSKLYDSPMAVSLDLLPLSGSVELS